MSSTVIEVGGSRPPRPVQLPCSPRPTGGSVLRPTSSPAVVTAPRWPRRARFRLALRRRRDGLDRCRVGNRAGDKVDKILLIRTKDTLDGTVGLRGGHRRTVIPVRRFRVLRQNAARVYGARRPRCCGRQGVEHACFWPGKSSVWLSSVSPTAPAATASWAPTPPAVSPSPPPPRAGEQEQDEGWCVGGRFSASATGRPQKTCVYLC